MIKKEMRTAEKERRYTSAQETQESRIEKKLTESVMWYKEKEKVKNGDTQDQEISQMGTGFSLETEEFKN